MVRKHNFFRSFVTATLVFASAVMAAAQSTPLSNSASTRIPTAITAMSPDQISREVLDQLTSANFRNEGGPARDDAVGGNWLYLRDYQGWGNMDWMFNNAGLDDYDIMTNPAQLATTDLYQYDVIWVKDFQTDAFNSAYNANRSYVDQWVADGGTLYSCDGTNFWGVAQIHPGGLTRVQFYDGQSFVATNSGECSMFDAVGWGLNTALNGGYHAHAGYTTGSLSAVDNGYQKLVTSDPNGNGTVITARYSYGDGQVVVSGSTDGAGFNWNFTWGAVNHSIFHYLLGISNVVQPPPGVVWEDNGHYYDAVPAAGLTWPQANAAANALSYTDGDGNYWYAHLLTVTSTEENQFIVDNFQNALQNIYFLGGHQVNFDNEPAGGWAWVTGEAWDYTNWGANEPNNQYGTEQIIHFWNLNGGWNDHQLYWQGNGYVVEYEMQDPTSPDIALSTGDLDFGSVLVNTSSDLTFQISNEGDADLNVSNVSTAGAGFSDDFGGAFTLAPGASQDITVTFSPNAVGNYSGSVTVSSDDEDEGTLTVNLTGTGIAPEIDVSPTSLDFGEVALFGEAQLTFDVSNSGTAALNVSSMSVTGDDFSVNFVGAVAIGVGSSQTFTVTYSADNYGAVSGSVDISSDDEDEPVVTVSLTGTAIAPIITVDPASLDFGTNEFRRDVADLTFDVCNEGNTGGNVNSMTVTGANFSCDFGGAFALAAGECATITVSFEAEEVGEASGDIEIESDDPVNGTANVSLAAEVVWVPSATLLGRLCQQVDALRTGGFLNRGQANSLCVKTDAAIRALGRGQTHVALNNLNAFRNHVTDFVANGVLTAAQGQALNDEANFISALITEFGTASENGRKVVAEMLPTELTIYSGYPNPFNSSTNIRFAMPEAGRVEMSLFDLSGREVSKLVSGNVEAGFHSITIEGNNMRSGMYLVRLNALGKTQNVKVTYIR